MSRLLQEMSRLLQEMSRLLQELARLLLLITPGWDPFFREHKNYKKIYICPFIGTQKTCVSYLGV